MSRLPITDSHLLPEFRVCQNGRASSPTFGLLPLPAPQPPLSAPQPTLSAPQHSLTISRNSSMSPSATSGARRLPHDIAKEGDNYLAPVEMPLSVWIEIEIHQVEDPENVFFQVVNEDHEALEVLMHQLQEIYTEGVGDPYKMPPSMIKAETVCAAKYENDWHRAYIESIANPTNVNIFYVDYGTRNIVDIKDLRLLKRRYLRLPFQARSGRLAGIRAISAEEGWSSTSSAFVLNFVRVNHFKVKKLAGMILSLEDRTHNLYVADVSIPGETHHLNDELVAAGHAQALDRPVATAAAVSAIKLSTKIGNSIDSDGYSGKVQLVFQGSRVFVFKIFTDDLPTNIECISIGERLFVTRGLLSRLLWPEARTPISAALKQKPLTHSEMLKTENLLLANLPSLQNEAMRANLSSIKGSDGNLLPKLTAHPLEALKMLATHFEARSKDLLHTCAEDILRAWKIGRLDHLVGNNVSPRTSLENNIKSDNDFETKSRNDSFGKFHDSPTISPPAIGLQQQPQHHHYPSSFSDPEPISYQSKSPSDSKATTRTSPVAVQITSTIFPANTANSGTVATAANAVDDEIFMSDEEDEIVGDFVLSSSFGPITASSIASSISPALSIANSAMPVSAIVSGSTSGAAAAAVPSSQTPADATAESVFALQRLVAQKQFEHQSLMDVMMVPSDQSGTPLEEIMSKMTKLNVEMEEIRSRLKTLKPEAGTPLLPNAWGGMGPMANGLGNGVSGGLGHANNVGGLGVSVGGGLATNAGGLGLSVGGAQFPTLAPGQNIAPAPPNYNPLSAPYIAPSFFGPAPSGSLGPAPSGSFFSPNNSSLFPASSANGFAPHSSVSVAGDASSSSLFPSSNLLNNVDNLFSSFGAPEAAFGPPRPDFNKEDDLSSLLRSPMLNASAPSAFLSGNGGSGNNCVGDYASASTTPGFNPMFGSGLNSGGGMAFGGNGFASNGFTSNGFASNGFTSNGFASNGFTSNGFASNGFDSNGFDSNGFASDGFGSNRFASGFGAGNAFGPLIGDPLYGGPDFLAGSAVTSNATVIAAAGTDVSLSPSPIGAEVSRSKFLPQIVAANRERNEDLSKEEQEAINILDTFKNMNF